VTDADADRVTELFALAFYDDPTWSWAFPDPEQRMDQHRLLWGLFLHSAIPYGSVWMTDDGGAASLRIPPGQPELGEADEARIEPLVRDLIGSHANDRRYERLGFVEIGEFPAPGSGPTVGCMWRDPR
jgi:hypothetical protein